MLTLEALVVNHVDRSHLIIPNVFLQTLCHETAVQYFRPSPQCLVGYLANVRSIIYALPFPFRFLQRHGLHAGRQRRHARLFQVAQSVCQGADEISGDMPLQVCMVSFV